MMSLTGKGRLSYIIRQVKRMLKMAQYNDGLVESCEVA